jgi:SAM-dependent methyltransferase
MGRIRIHRSPDGVRLDTGKRIPRSPVGPWRDHAPRLSVGCGALRIDGWTHLDRCEAVEPDVVHDLERPPMPFPDDHFGYAWADNVLEHLSPGRDGLFPALADVWRVLRPGGLFEVTSPTYPHPESFKLDHRLVITESSFRNLVLAPRREGDLNYPEWHGFTWEWELVDGRKSKGKGVVVLEDSNGAVFEGYARRTWIMRAVKNREE